MDIEESKILLKDFQKGKIEKDKLETYKGGYKLGYFYTVGIQEAIETVLSELEKYKTKYENLKLRNKGTKEALRVSEDLEKHFSEEASTLEAELEKKEKIIDEMSNFINLISNELVAETGDNNLEFCKMQKCIDDGNLECAECIKQYFTNKAEKEGK